MNKLCGIAVAIGLVAAPLAWAAPLSPGKPAGVHHSQMTTSSWVVAGGLGAIALTVIAVAASGDDKGAAQNQSSATTATSS